MNILKTPQQKLMEDAGAIPGSPGMLNTPKQMLMQESGVMPNFASGGEVQMTPEEMLAELFINNREPQHFATGGQPEATSPELAQLLDRLYSQRIYSGEMPPLPPEPTFQAQPATLTSRARNATASLLGEKPADRLFGTGEEGQKSEYLPLQFLNPVSAATETIDSIPAALNMLREGNNAEAGLTMGMTGLGVLPFAKPIKNIIKKIKRK